MAHFVPLDQLRFAAFQLIHYSFDIQLLQPWAMRKTHLLQEREGRGGVTRLRLTNKAMILCSPPHIFSAVCCFGRLSLEERAELRFFGWPSELDLFHNENNEWLPLTSLPRVSTLATIALSRSFSSILRPSTLSSSARIIS